MKLKAAILCAAMIIISAVSALAASIEMTEENVTVTGSSEESALITAAYKDGVLTECKIYTGDGVKSYAEDMALADADEVKAFLWDMSMLTPLCAAGRLSIKGDSATAEPIATPTTAPEPTSEATEDESDEYKICLTANGTELTAVLYKNSTTDAIVEMLPLTLPMMDLYDREMCYRFEDALPTDNAVTQSYEVGEIVYWPPGHSFVIMYAQNDERFQMQKLGYIESGVEFFETSGDVDVTIELIE